MENLWPCLIRIIYGNGQQYNTVKGWRESITEVWNHTLENIFQGLVDSMADRIYNVVYNHGKLCIDLFRLF